MPEGNPQIDKVFSVHVLRTDHYKSLYDAFKMSMGVDKMADLRPEELKVAGK